MYGLVGAGRSELARSILGLHEVTSGQVLINGSEAKIKNFTEALHKYRIGYVTENRKEEGLFLDFPVRKNISVTILAKILQRLSVINPKKKMILLPNMLIALALRLSIIINLH